MTTKQHHLRENCERLPLDVLECTICSPLRMTALAVVFLSLHQDTLITVWHYQLSEKNT